MKIELCPFTGQTNKIFKHNKQMTITNNMKENLGNMIVDILLVDDSLEDAEMTIRALKKNGLANNLLHLEDGEEALNYLFAPPSSGQKLPKIILLDLKMPKVGGIEVLEKLKGDEKLKRIPVVVLTSSKEERDIMDTYRLGVNAYIVKPVDVEKFIKAITELGFFWLVLNEVPDRSRQ